MLILNVDDFMNIIEVDDGERECLYVRVDLGEWEIVIIIIIIFMWSMF